jgi:DNA mismatch endonuclease (patch repair protein)
VRTTTPSTREAFWLDKFRANQERDQRARQELAALDWRVETIWECETKCPKLLRKKMADLLTDLDQE